MSSRTEARRRQHFFPYRYARHGLGLRIAGCRLDEQRNLAIPDETTAIIDLSDYRFRAAELELELDVPTSILGEVFPPNNASDPPGGLVVVTHCGPTKTRVAQRIEISGPLAGVHEARVRLAHDALRGTADISAYLCRTQPGDVDDGLDGFGVSPGARLANSRTWQIHVDKPRQASGDYLDIRYASFRELGEIQFPWPDNLYQLECSSEDPILWLNLDHADVCDVLNAQGTVGRQARMRDMFFDHVGAAVWTRLFLRAAWAVREYQDAALPWQTRVLRTWLPLLYPRARGHLAQLTELRNHLTQGEEDAVLALLEGAIQKRLEIARHMTKLSGELA